VSYGLPGEGAGTREQLIAESRFLPAVGMTWVCSRNDMGVPSEWRVCRWALSQCRTDTGQSALIDSDTASAYNL